MATWIPALTIAWGTDNRWDVLAVVAKLFSRPAENAMEEFV
jgi:hypothetical protein